ncbi:MAG TPA: plastocyanin/azurin family copper-binding protein [Solirubrobacterales bacterium]|nr:plastocyanin/azurin family copper-binding protein [Solirubrobacterales bacterium]
MALGVLYSQASALAEGPTVEPAETTSGYVWRPSALTVAPGGSVGFANPSAIVPHGLAWTGGPQQPSCSGVPVGSSGTEWSGACTFAQAGTYTFVCTVHPEEMKGTITVGSGETGPAPAPGSPAPPVSAEGPLISGLRVVRNQRGAAVRGSFATSSAAVGGAWRVEVEARRAALGGRGKALVPVGAIFRSVTRAGRHRFAVRLKPRALRVLRSRGHLSLNVRVAVAPPDDLPVARSRRVKLHAP